MSRVGLYTIVCALFFTQLCCKTEVASPAVQTLEATPTPKLTVTSDDPLLLEDIFVDNDRLAYGNFIATKLSRKVDLGGPPGLIDISYALLKKNGKIVAKFDGDVYFGAGNSIDFGLFSFLSPDTKQLLVSQRVPRGGAHWVADISTDGGIMFDSTNYEVGREEFQVIDVDKDGTFEILLPVVSFYMFEDMGMAETPLPPIIFKYDKERRKYYPANPEFSDYTLRGIEEDIKNLGPNDSAYLSQRLDIVLRYIYSGKEDEAWLFFDKEYNRPDSEEMKTKIKSEIVNGGAYKYIYRKSSSKPVDGRMQVSLTTIAYTGFMVTNRMLAMFRK